MKPRILLPLIVVTPLLAGGGAWWMLESKSRRTEAIPSVQSPASAPSEPARLDGADSKPSAPSPREPIVPAAPAPVKKSTPNARKTSGTLSGRVISAADGTEIIDAYVHLERFDAAAPQDPPIADRSDLDGHYAIYGAPEGDWKLVCSARSFAKAEVRVSMTMAGGKKQQDFRLQPDPRMNLVVHLHAPGGGSLFDHLVAEDAALVDLLRPAFVEQCPPRGSELPSGTSVFAFQGRAVDHVHAFTDEWQRVQFQSARGGCCAVLLGDRVLDAAAFTAGMSDLTLVVSIEDLHHATGWLRLEIVDAATSAPIKGARVSLRTAGPKREVVTDAAGRAEFADLLPGEGVCELAAAGHWSAPRRVTIQAGYQTDLCTIRMAAGLVVSGTIDMPDPVEGTPPAGVFVYACRIADAEGIALEANVRSKTDGTFEFPQLYSGEYVIGWEHRNPSPDRAAVKRGEIKGWAYVDARFGDVSGVHIPVTQLMWDPSGARTSR